MNQNPHWLTEEEVRNLRPDASNRKDAWPDPNPVLSYGGKWYFWDECWAYCFGPFDTQHDANRAVAEYAKNL